MLQPPDSFAFCCNIKIHNKLFCRSNSICHYLLGIKLLRIIEKKCDSGFGNQNQHRNDFARSERSDSEGNENGNEVEIGVRSDRTRNRRRVAQARRPRRREGFEFRGNSFRLEDRVAEIRREEPRQPPQNGLSGFIR